MFKSTHPLTRLFWIALVVGVVVYQLKKTEYPGSDAVIVEIDTHHEYSSQYGSESPCVLPVVFYQKNSNQLDVQAVQDLNEIAQRLIQNPGMKLEISGKQGKYEKHGLASQREEAVVNFLQDMYNIRRNRLVIATDDSDHFESPSHKRSHSYNHHGHDYVKKSCKSQSYTYSYSYSCNKNKNRSYHSSCSKNVKKEDRAVYVTCVN